MLNADGGENIYDEQMRPKMLSRDTASACWKPEQWHQSDKKIFEEGGLERQPGMEPTKRSQAQTFCPQKAKPPEQFICIKGYGIQHGKSILWFCKIYDVRL